MIRKLVFPDFEVLLAVINDGAQAYKGVIPVDRWKEPYMPVEELREELESGVAFFGWEENNEFLGVMGIQPVEDITLIRHAYVRTECQRRGIGSKLLNYLMPLARTSEVLVGTWAAATWAIQFYERFGFVLVSTEEKNRLLRRYWNIPERLVETSVVLRCKK
jgi:GNAT superfamily N-acetyltransferase